MTDDDREMAAELYIRGLKGDGAKYASRYKAFLQGDEERPVFSEYFVFLADKEKIQKILAAIIS
jgi:hypothetical protein